MDAHVKKLTGLDVNSLTPGEDLKAGWWTWNKEVLLLCIGLAAYFVGIVFGAQLNANGHRITLYVLYSIPLLGCGLMLGRMALQGLLHGQWMNEPLLLVLVCIGAVWLGAVAEGAGVIIVGYAGLLLRQKIVGKVLASINRLLSLKPASARVFVQNELVSKGVDEVVPGDFIQVGAGERVPLDGVVITGVSYIDQGHLGTTGEVRVEAGHRVWAGSLNRSSALTIRASCLFADTELAKIMQAVEAVVASKAPTEVFVGRFAKGYALLICLLALAVAVIPTVFFGFGLDVWVYKALVLLMVAYPGALLVSVLLGYFGGVGAAHKIGVLVKNCTVFDDLTSVDTVVFDKTGTLTAGSFEVQAVLPVDGVSAQDLLQVAFVAEASSVHPIAKSIKKYAVEQGLAIDSQLFDTVQELPGMGLAVILEGDRFLAGNDHLLREFGVSITPLGISSNLSSATIVHVAKNKIYYGVIAITDSIKPDSAATIAGIKSMGLKTYLLSGDKEQAASWVADSLGLSGYWAELLPEGKVQAMKAITDASRTLFVGDGLNDAPTLAHARVGVAMSCNGIGAPAEARVNIANDMPSSVAELLRLSVKVRSVVWQNVFVVFGVKTSIVVLAMVGFCGLWEAVLADTLASLFVVSNAARSMR